MTCRMQKEQFSRFEKLEAVVDELQHGTVRFNDTVFYSC